MKTVFVKDRRRNLKVRHGYFEGLSFVRFLDNWKGVRWSDRSFTLNNDIFKSKKYKPFFDAVKFYKWIVRDASCTQTQYRISKEILETCEMIVNEYGEETIRIPIDICETKILS